MPLSLKFMPLRAGAKVGGVKNRNPLKIKHISIVKGYASDNYTKKVNFYFKIVYGVWYNKYRICHRIGP